MRKIYSTPHLYDRGVNAARAGHAGIIRRFYRRFRRRVPDAFAKGVFDVVEGVI